MTALRRQILHHPALAAWLLAFALLVKVLVPAGYMTVVSGGIVTLEICSGMESGAEMPAMPHAMPGMPMHHGGQEHPGKADMPCAFAGMTAPATAAADPVLLVLAVAFIIALARRAPATVAPRAPPRLRPPLRGPPATA